MKVILLIIAYVCILNAGFIKSGDIVVDDISGLEWSDSSASRAIFWNDAIDTCEKLILDGHRDWRLPNVNELKSIIDRSNYYPAIRREFHNTNTNYYWTSSIYKGTDNASVWSINFGSGYIMNKNKLSKCYFRCVRGE